MTPFAPAPELAEEVDPDHSIPRFHVIVEERAAAPDAGVEEHHVHLAVVLVGRGCEVLDGCVVRHVGFHTEHFGSSAPELLHGGRQRRAIDIGQDELHPVLGQKSPGGSSDPPFATATGDHRDSASQFFHRPLLRKPVLMTEHG
jgi:hypothetical protein